MDDSIAVKAGNRCLTLGDAIDRLEPSIETGDDALVDHVAKQLWHLVGVVEVEVGRQPDAAFGRPVGDIPHFANDFSLSEGTGKRTQ